MTPIETHIFKLQVKHANMAAKLAKAAMYGGYSCGSSFLKLTMLRSILKVLWSWNCGESCLTEEEACELVKKANLLYC